MNNILSFREVQNPLTDKDIYGGVEYNRVLNSDIDLQVGDVSSAYVKFKVKSLEIDNVVVIYVGNKFTYTTTNPTLTVGKFIITEIVKGKTDYTVTAYDFISKFDVDCTEWKNTLIDPDLHDFVNPISLEDLLLSLINFFPDLSQQTVNSFVNDDYMVKHCYIDDGVSMRQVLSFIASASGGFAYADADGHIQIKNYGDTSAKTFTSSNFKQLERAEYMCPEIDTV